MRGTRVAPELLTREVLTEKKWFSAPETYVDHDTGKKLREKRTTRNSSALLNLPTVGNVAKHERSTLPELQASPLVLVQPHASAGPFGTHTTWNKCSGASYSQYHGVRLSNQNPRWTQKLHLPPCFPNIIGADQG